MKIKEIDKLTGKELLELVSRHLKQTISLTEKDTRAVEDCLEMISIEPGLKVIFANPEHYEGLHIQVDPEIMELVMASGEDVNAGRFVDVDPESDD